MKFVLLLIAFALILCPTHGFWSECPGSGVIGPDLITSPNCSEDRCRGVRGELLTADILVTWGGSHNELRTRATAFLFGVGINLPINYPYDDACNVITFPDFTPTTCPTTAGVQYRISISVQVSQLVPTMNNARIQVDFFDGEERVACGQLDAVDIV